MSNFILITDSTADLPRSYYVEHDLRLLYIPYIIDGITYDGENQLDEKEFYKKMRAGSMPTTTQINPEHAKIMFRKWMEETDSDILYLCFTSGLSGNYNGMRLAAQELEEEGCSHKVYVIDSLCTAMGEGLLVHKAVQMRDSGMSLEEMMKQVTALIPHVVHNFTVDDLFHLHRGGRVSMATAVVGSMVNIKPILHVDNEGKLAVVGKVRGRKKSLHAMLDAMEKQMGSYRDQNDIVFISHGDCIEDAEYVANLIREHYGIDQILINYMGPTIGAHTGPGVITLHYIGEYR